MFLRVSQAKYRGAFCIEVTFNDGRVGTVDLSGRLQGPMFEVLQDPLEFAKFTVEPELQTIAWSNGADLAPEYLYFLAFKDDAELQPQFRRWGFV